MTNEAAKLIETLLREVLVDLREQSRRIARLERGLDRIAAVQKDVVDPGERR